MMYWTSCGKGMWVQCELCEVVNKLELGLAHRELSSLTFLKYKGDSFHLDDRFLPEGWG